jgi:hypothetical protein
MAGLTPSPKQQIFGSDGLPLVGGKIYTYAAGTSTPIATYTDYTANTANTNPIILDSFGQANIWLINVTSYKFVVTDANDVLLYTVDNISIPLDAASMGSPPPIGNIVPNTGAFTTLSATGTVTFSGQVNFTGTGAAKSNVGTTPQRPATPVAGMFRYNTTLGTFEGYGTSWGPLGGGASGGGGNSIFYENDQTVTIAYSITSGKNAMSTGPITITGNFDGIGSISGTILTITSASSGALYVGSEISGTNVTAGTTISAFASGTGGIGTYVVSPSQTAISGAITTTVSVTVPSGSRWVIL